MSHPALAIEERIREDFDGIAGERYLTMREARALARRLGPSANVARHRYWRYTLVWRSAS